MSLIYNKQHNINKFQVPEGSRLELSYSICKVLLHILLVLEIVEETILLSFSFSCSHQPSALSPSVKLGIALPESSFSHLSAFLPEPEAPLTGAFTWICGHQRWCL